MLLFVAGVIGVMRVLGVHVFLQMNGSVNFETCSFVDILNVFGDDGVGGFEHVANWVVHTLLGPDNFQSRKLLIHYN